MSVPGTEREVLDVLARHYAGLGRGRERYVVAEHVRDASGFAGSRTADLVACDMWPSSGLDIIGHEVKVSRSDWLTELRDPSKAEAVRRFCHRWYLVVPDPAIVRGDLPTGWGLLLVGSGSVVEMARPARLSPAAVTTREETALFSAALVRASAKTGFERGRASAGEGRAERSRKSARLLSQVRSSVAWLARRDRSADGAPAGSCSIADVYASTKRHSRATQEQVRTALASMWAAGEVDLVADRVVLKSRS